MPGDIEVQELRSLSVSPDGSAFRIGVQDEAGSDIGLVFPSDALKSLLPSLFRAGDVASKRLLNDASARLVYPVETCRLQSAPGMSRTILVLTTADGFDAAFAIAPEALAALAELALEVPSKQAVLPTRLN